jgi:transcriptional regulator with XRE-family HTH domain
MTLGTYLKSLRSGKMTQEQLAKQCHISRIMVAWLETDRRKPSLALLLKILAKLDAGARAEATALSLLIKANTGRTYRLRRGETPPPTPP